MLISLVLHAVLLLFNHTLGAVLSNLYVPLAILLFHTLSYAHTYKYHVHSVLRVIVSPFEYCVHPAQQFANVAVVTHVQ